MNEQYEQKEILGFSRSMFGQCILLYLGICAGLWVHSLFLVLVAGYTLGVAVFAKTESLYYHLFFSLPFTMIYKLSPASSSLFAYVLLAAGIIMLFRIRSFGLEQFLLILFFATYILVGMGGNFTGVLKMLMCLVLFYYFVQKIQPDEYKNQIMSFSLGMVGSSFIGLLKGDWPRLDAYFSDMKTIYIAQGQEEGMRFTGLYLDPNYFSISVIFAITLCFILFYTKQGNRPLLGTVCILLLWFGFLTYSKMFVLAISLVALTFLLMSKKTPSSVVFILIIVFLGGYALYGWMMQSGYLDVMTRRVTEGDISTGRFDLWKDYLGYISSSPRTLLFGDGLGAPYRLMGGPHSTYIETIYFLGILGGTLFLTTILHIFKSKRYLEHGNFMNYVLLITFCVMIATLGCLMMNDFLFHCMLLWMSLNINNRLQERT